MSENTKLNISISLQYIVHTALIAMSSIILYFVQSNYKEFQSMKEDIQIDKQRHAAQDEFNKNIVSNIESLNARLEYLEQSKEEKKN